MKIYELRYMCLLLTSSLYTCDLFSLLDCFLFISGVSRTSLVNSVILMVAYNVFYTSVPVLVSALEKDLSDKTRLQTSLTCILFLLPTGKGYHFAAVLLGLNAIPSF
jgi:hypothetical protein